MNIIIQTTKCTIRANNFKTKFTNLLICKIFIKQCFTQTMININEMLTYYQCLKIKIYGNIRLMLKLYRKQIDINVINI